MLFSSKYVDEERVIQAKSNNKVFRTYDNANDIVDELFESLLSKYQDNLKTSMKGRDFDFDSVQLLCFRCGRLFIDSPD